MFALFYTFMYIYITKCMKGCVTLESNKNQNKKYRMLLVILCAALIAGPFLIRTWILLPVLDLDIIKKLNPNVNEADMLNYWGTALSCISTSLLAYVAIRQSDKANEINDRLLNLQEREGKEAYVNLSQDNIRFEEKNGYRFVELKFDNITKVPISNIDIKGCGKRIIGFKEKNFHVNSKGTSVFISKYENIRDNMTYDPLSNRYYLYFSDYKETFRILSFKVIITSLYGVTTVQYFNVLMLKSHVADCMCTL